jgi:hypothetical protein
LNRFFGTRRSPFELLPERHEPTPFDLPRLDEASRFEILDLRLYASASEHLDRLVRASSSVGAGAAAYTWVRNQTLSPLARRYVYKGFARLLGHPEGYGWDDLPENEELDRYVRAIYRAWIDRFGPRTVSG